jgi:hypothetical protein
MLSGLVAWLLVTVAVRVPCLAIVAHRQTMAFILDMPAVCHTQEVEEAAMAAGSIPGAGNLTIAWTLGVVRSWWVGMAHPEI